MPTSSSPHSATPAAPAEAAIEPRPGRQRQRIGLVLGPVVLLVLWGAPLAGLDVPAQRLLAIVGLVITLWVTEALPLPVTALLGPALCVVAGLGSAKEVFGPFADPIIFLFLGSFLLAAAMFRHGLNRRIAFCVLGMRWVGTSPARVLVAFAVITAGLSMWISNTTTAAMMCPIGLAILSEIAHRQSAHTGQAIHFTQVRFGTGLMLVAAFGASLGGLGTPVGSPPNLIGLGMLERYLEVRVSFFEWMLFGLPIVVVLVAFLVFYLHAVCPAAPGLLAGSGAWIRQERERLGRLSRGERNVIAAFAVTVSLWLLPGVVVLATGPDAPLARWLDQRLPESVAALLGGTLLFLLPVSERRGEYTLSWRQAVEIDWGTILLFGGGLSLGALIFSTGLGEWIGGGLARGVHAQSPFALTLLFTAVAILFTETTSNTASATMVVPVAIAVAQAVGVDSLQPALGACLGASMAFMLPVSTPPNAIVYGTGCVTLPQMLRHGIVVDLVGYVVIVVTVTWWVPLLR
ncbi:MAG: SLC13/DASS family transporter [Verrucomicrobia bacterium]|nr:SLC13/DASS family transporter [Verrucomicrobiota bacterium]